MYVSETMNNRIYMQVFRLQVMDDINLVLT